MPRVVRTADVSWEGNLARGTGSISGGSGALAGLPYSVATRVGAPEGKTSPEELLAAAHAGSFAMSLAAELTGAGTPPGTLDVTCTVTLDEVPGKGHLIVRSELAGTASVDGVDEQAFAAAVKAADEGCTFSALIRASAEVSAELRLV